MKATRNYSLLLVSQFLSAFGDNALLSVILGPLTFQRADGLITEQQVNSANAFFSALFFLPFIVLAPLAGFLNDRFPKTAWLFGGNLIKLLGTGIGAAGLLLHAEWQALGYCVVGVGACCYSPAKYGILPEILPADRLVKANGTVEMLTLVAILTGLGLGANLIDRWPLFTCYGVVAIIYAVSLGFNLCMKRTPHNSGARLRRSAAEFFRNLLALITHPRLGRVLLGTGMFWYCGATLRTNLQGWGLEIFKQANASDVNNTKLIQLKLWLAVGIIIGSVLAGQFHRMGDLRGVRWYAWCMAAFILPLGLLVGTMNFFLVVSVLTMTGVSAGLFLVPLNAALQGESDQTKLGKTIAVQNFIDYLSMLMGAGFVLALSSLSLTAARIFIALAAFIAIAAFALRIPRRNDPPREK